MYKQRKAVDLPNLTPKLLVPRYVAKQLELIIAAGSSGVTKETLMAAGYSSPTIVIRNLIASGFRIERTRVSVFDVTGKQYKSVSYYRYNGLLNPEDLGNSSVNLTGDK